MYVHSCGESDHTEFFPFFRFFFLLEKSDFSPLFNRFVKNLSIICKKEQSKLRRFFLNSRSKTFLWNVVLNFSKRNFSISWRRSLRNIISSRSHPPFFKEHGSHTEVIVKCHLISVSRINNLFHYLLYTSIVGYMYKHIYILIRYLHVCPLHEGRKGTPASGVSNLFDRWRNTKMKEQKKKKKRNKEKEKRKWNEKTGERLRNNFTTDVLTTPLRGPSCRCLVRAVAVAVAAWPASNARPPWP